MATNQQRIILRVAYAGIAFHLLFILLHGAFALALTQRVRDRMRSDPEYIPPYESWEEGWTGALIITGIPICIYAPGLLATVFIVTQIVTHERKTAVIKVIGISLGIFTALYAVFWLLNFP